MSTPNFTLGSWFAARASRSAHRRALSFEGTTWTYGELLDRIDRLATVLARGGIVHGSRIGFLGANQPALLETFLAASRLGAIFVPLNFRLAGAELEMIVNDAGVHTLVVDGEHSATIDTIAEKLCTVRYLNVDRSDGLWSSYDELIESANPITSPVHVDNEDIALLMYTSGTTGKAKGVMLSHTNLWWNNTNLLHLFDVLENDATLVVAPLFHIAGLNVTTFTTWQKGGEVVLHRRFDPTACLNEISNRRITTLFGVPAMLSAVSQDPSFSDRDLSSLRMIICGGAPVPEALLHTFAARGIAVLQGYGLTETAPSATFLVAEHALTKLGSAGKAPLFTEVQVVDANGTQLTGVRDQGEICVRGPNVTRGYWNNPEATAAAIDQDGWFHTGDVGYFDREGFMYVVDRIKDMIISGGENVYPAEVENVLYGHMAVTEVAVVGLPDDRWGEAVAAIVAPTPGHSLTLEDLRDYGASRLARYKLPTRLILVDELPRNPSGKVLKYQLRAGCKSELKNSSATS